MFSHFFFLVFSLEPSLVHIFSSSHVHNSLSHINKNYLSSFPLPTKLEETSINEEWLGILYTQDRLVWSISFYKSKMYGICLCSSMKEMKNMHKLIPGFRELHSTCKLVKWAAKQWNNRQSINYFTWLEYEQVERYISFGQATFSSIWSGVGGEPSIWEGQPLWVWAEIRCHLVTLLSLTKVCNNQFLHLSD